MPSDTATNQIKDVTFDEAMRLAGEGWEVRPGEMGSLKWMRWNEAEGTWESLRSDGSKHGGGYMNLMPPYVLHRGPWQARPPKQQDERNE